MVEVVDRHPEPEGEVGFFVLDLVCIGRKRSVADGTERKSDACGDRNQESCPGDQQAWQGVVGELAPPPLGLEVAVVFRVPFAHELSLVHEAVNGVLDKRSQQQTEDECDGEIEDGVVLGQGGLRPLSRRNVVRDYNHSRYRLRYWMLDPAAHTNLPADNAD